MIKNAKLTHGTRSLYIKQLQEMDLTKPMRLTVEDWRGKRGLSANAIQHKWYSQIAKQRGDVTALDVKNECKDMLGLPILLNSAVHGDKIEFLLHKLDYYKHSYESKLKLVSCLEVTSLFNTAESKEYMEQMIMFWNDRGILIKFPDKE